MTSAESTLQLGEIPEERHFLSRAFENPISHLAGIHDVELLYGSCYKWTIQDPTLILRMSFDSFHFDFYAGK
jgi:hypothetical protein